MLANRAALQAPSLLARSASGSLAEPGGIADGHRIRWVQHRHGGFFVVRTGWARTACDVFPERGMVAVFAAATAIDLAAVLGIERYSFVQTVFSSR